ncbi:MAG: hybrid sensor histidine kinase/response regulator [Saprospiraceae bacterium]|nr:MAG: hybrid sensor histidine kinase/response regulator [Saprospiraceae bacterium]
MLPCLIIAQHVKVDKITIEDGLSQGMIFKILQDSDGFLWFATKDGLNRYDGYSFDYYNHQPADTFSLSGHIVNTIFEDSRGWLWVGTNNNGLNLFDRQTGKFHHLMHQPGRNNTLQSNNIHAIEEDKQGNIWVGTSIGLDKITIPGVVQKGAAIQPTQVNALKITRTPILLAGNLMETRVLCILNQNDGDQLLGTQSGIFLKKSQEKEAHQWLDGAFVCKEEPDCPVNSIVQTADGTLIFGQSNSIYKVKQGVSQAYPLPESLSSISIRLAIGKEGTIYGASSGLFQFDAKAEVSKAISPIFQETGIHNLPSFCIDATGVLWLGTNGYGLIKYNPAASVFNHFAENKSIRQLYVDQENRTWVWTNGKFHLLDPDTKQLSPLREFPKIVADCRWMLQDKKGDFWLHYPITEEGVRLVHYDPETKQLQEYYYQRKPYPLANLAEDKQGNIWMATAGPEIIKFDPIKKVFSYFSYAHHVPAYKSEIISSVLSFDASGTLWIGTPFGILRFDEDKAAQEPFQIFHHQSGVPHSLSENYILSILPDPLDDNLLWIGTKGGGLNRMEKDKARFTNITTRDGLPNDVIYSILSDKSGQLWLSSNRGLSCYNYRRGTFDNYTSFDGLQNNEFNTRSSAIGQDEQLLFGGVNGFNIFQPTELQTPGSPPNVVITDLKVNNEKMDFRDSSILHKPIEYTHQLDLSYQQNLLHFKFSVLDFAVSSRNRYRYQMEGVDKQWVEADYTREVTYANLAPGHYTFKVSGTNRSMVWSDPPTEIHIRIRPPWWQTTPAYLGFALIFLSIAWGIYRFQLYRIRLKNQLAFEQKEAERLADLNQMKTNFFSNITHEFRTPLTLIIEPARHLIQELKEGVSREKASLIQTNARRLLRLVNQLLDLSKIESRQMPLYLQSGNVVDTVWEVFQSFIPLADKKGINLHWQGSRQQTELSFDKNKIEQIISNLLSNALKFTPNGGNIELELDVSFSEKENPMLHLKIKDNGIGIEADHLDQVFDRFYQVENHHLNDTNKQSGTGIGLALVKELVNLMHGTIQVESQQGVGTVFTIDLPIQLTRSVMGEGSEEVINYTGQSNPAVARNQQESNKNAAELPLVLIVEDNIDLRDFMQSVLQSKFKIITAQNGAEGLRKAVKFIPDLIISDIMMPIMDGYSLCKQLKVNIQTAHIPIILLTARSSFESRMKGLKIGADAYLTKPFNTDELKVHIENLVSTRKKLQERYSTQIGKAKKDTAFFTPPDNQFIKELCQAIDRKIDDETLSTEQLATMVQMSRSQLHRKLKALTNQSATEFLRNYRLDKAIELLQQQKGNVSEVAFMIGFGSQPYFSTRFKERFGFSPKEAGMSSAN